MKNTKVLLVLMISFGSLFSAVNFPDGPIVCRIYYQKDKQLPVCHFQHVKTGDLRYRNALSFDDFCEYGAFPGLAKASRYVGYLSCLTFLFLSVLAHDYSDLYSSSTPVEHVWGGEIVRRFSSKAWKVLLIGLILLKLYNIKTARVYREIPILSLVNSFRGKSFALYNIFNNYKEISLLIESSAEKQAFLEEIQYFGKNYDIEIIGADILVPPPYEDPWG